MSKNTITQQFISLNSEIISFMDEVKSRLLSHIPNGSNIVYRVKKITGEEPELSEHIISYVKVLYPILNNGKYMGKPTINKRATQKDLNELKEHFEYIKACYNNGKMSLLFLFEQTGKNQISRAYYPYEFVNINNNYIYFFDKEKATSEYKHCLEEYKEKYKQRSGYIPCTYCRRQVSEMDVLWAEPLKRNNSGVLKEIRLPFCSEECLRYWSISNS